MYSEAGVGDNASMEGGCQKSDILRIKRGFLAFIGGFFLNYSAYVSVLNLQSSINVEDGLGTISAAIAYLICAIFNLFLTPILLRKFGPKICLLFGEFAYLTFILANLYPAFYTLIPAALLLGMGEAMTWIATSLLNVYYATLYSVARKHPRKRNNFYVNLHSGYFFTIVQMCQICGNLLSYALLYGFTSNDKETGEEYKTANDSLITELPVDSYKFCGAKDCQDRDTVEESIDQYVPSNNLTTIVLICILAGICVAGQVLHWLYLPAGLCGKKDIAVDIHKTVDEGHTFNEEDSTEYDEDNTSSKSKNCTNPTGFWVQYVKALKDTAYQFKEARQILLTPMCLYVGFFESFVFSEMTRAYSSCVLGVAKVGLCMSTYGLSNAIMSCIVGKFGNTWGRIPFFVVSTLCDICSFGYCLFWSPNEESSWSIFLIFFALGSSDGIWQTFLNIVHLEYFEASRDVAMSVWNFWITVGYAIQYSWSTRICVYVKLYIQLSLLVLGVVCYGFAEWIDGRKK